MALGDAWSETTTGSASKLNQVTLTYGTGAYLATLDKTKHKLVACTSTGDNFTIDHIYLASADGTEWIDLTDVNDHYHTGAGDGGTFVGMMTSNAIMDTGSSLFQTVRIGNQSPWQEGSSGTAVQIDATDGTTDENYIEMDTGATSGSTAQEYIAINLSVNGTIESKFAAKHKIQTATSLALKCGMGMESLASADSNTRKYGGEICTTVNSNWFAASANGTTRSSSDTGQAMSTSKRAIIGVCNPSNPDFKLWIEDSTLYTKTSNVPITQSDNQPSRGAIFRYSVKNNTGASRKFNFYGARLMYFVDDDSLWF